VVGPGASGQSGWTRRPAPPNRAFSDGLSYKTRIAARFVFPQIQFRSASYDESNRSPSAAGTAWIAARAPGRPANVEELYE
jgi:hypothetical protein